MRHIDPPEELVFTLGEHHSPVATIEPEDRGTIRALDSYTNKITSERDRVSEQCPPPYVNPVTGPVLVDGAEPGDALLVHIGDIQPGRDFAVTALVPNFGGLTRTRRTALLHASLPERTRLMPVDEGGVHFNDRIVLPWAPFIGTPGWRRKEEAISSLVPDYFGGNLDCIETGPGAAVVLPVQVAQAHFFIGDGHATQGDGEVTGVAAEIPTVTRLRFELRKGGRAGLASDRDGGAADGRGGGPAAGGRGADCVVRIGGLARHGLRFRSA